MKKLLFKFKNFIFGIRYKIKPGRMYACRCGFYAGQLLIFIKSEKEEYGFLAIPKMENQWVPKEKFDFAIRNGIIEFVEDVPVYVKKVAFAKFRDNKI